MCSIVSGRFTEDLFPVSTSLTTHLVARGADSVTAEKLLNAYLKGVYSLKQKMEFEYTQASNSILSTGPEAGGLASKLLSILSLRYKQTLAMWSNEVLKKADHSIFNSVHGHESSVKLYLRRFIIFALNSPFPTGQTQETAPHPTNQRCCAGKSRSLRCSLCVYPPTYDQKHSVLATKGRPQYSFPCTYPPPARPSPLPQTPLERLLPHGYTLNLTTRQASASDMEDLTVSFATLSLHSVKTSPHQIPKIQARLGPQKAVLATAVENVTVSAISDTTFTNPHLEHYSTTGQGKVRVLPKRQSSTRSIPISRPKFRVETYDSSPESSYGGRTPSLTSDSGSEASSPPTPLSDHVGVLPLMFPYQRLDCLPLEHTHREVPGVTLAIRSNDR